MRKYLAYGVHLFTAMGAWAGLEACLAISHSHFKEAFLYMFLAVAIDSVDGSLARALRVSDNCPSIDGRRLDDMVDYFTWVVTPVYFMVAAQLLPQSPLIWALPLVCSALGMSHRDAKTEDDFFLGFPSLWNVVALYLWWGGLPADLNAGVVVTLALAVLAPLKFIYPSKTAALRTLTSVTMLIWIAVTVSSLVLDSGWLKLLSLLFPIYYMAFSLYLNFFPQPQGAGGGSLQNGNHDQHE